MLFRSKSTRQKNGKKRTDLVDNEKIGLGERVSRVQGRGERGTHLRDSGSSLARNLVTARDINLQDETDQRFSIAAPRKTVRTT